MEPDLDTSIPYSTIFLVWTKPETALPKLARRGYAEVISWGTDGDLALWTVETKFPHCVTAILDRLRSIVQYTEEESAGAGEQMQWWVESYRGWRNPLLADV
jgi:hypothetical protein